MRMVYHIRAGTLVNTACVLATVAAGAAHAQSLDRIQPSEIAGVGTAPGVTVLSRLRPEYDYPGVRLGSVTVRPEIVSSTGYDDNVLGTSAKHGSAVQETQVNLGAATDWSRNSLSAGLHLDDTRFFDQPRQSYTAWNATVGGTLLVGRDTASLDYYHQNLVQTPRDLNTALLDSAIDYRIDTAIARYSAVFNRLTLKPALQVANFSFDNGTVGGSPYVQTYRDRVVTTPELVAEYELAPQRLVVGDIRHSIASYRAPTAGQLVRDYDDTAVLAGLDYQATGPFRFRLLVGYEVRRFTSRAYRTIQAPVAEGRVVWTPTGLTTVTTTVSRQIADSADETTAGLTQTAGTLAVDHELLRNILLHGEATVANVSFGQGGGSQTLVGAGAGATWLVNRHARLGLDYHFATRQNGDPGTAGSVSASQPTGGNYTENRLLLQLRLGL